MNPIDLDTLLAYHLGELDPAAEADVEEQVFSDAATARRLEAVVRTGDALRSLVRSGRLTAALTAGSLARLRAEGVTVHTYVVRPDEVCPCGPVPEDLVALRLTGDFAGDTADLELEMTAPDGTPILQRHAGVPVDATTREIVLVQPGSFIRSLPKHAVRISVREGGAEQVFRLDHDPARPHRDLA
jgi:hypothetical protein